MAGGEAFRSALSTRKGTSCRANGAIARETEYNDILVGYGADKTEKHVESNE